MAIFDFWFKYIFPAPISTHCGSSPYFHVNTTESEGIKCVILIHKLYLFHRTLLMSVMSILMTFLRVEWSAGNERYLRLTGTWYNYVSDLAVKAGTLTTHKNLKQTELLLIILLNYALFFLITDMLIRRVEMKENRRCVSRSLPLEYPDSHFMYGDFYLNSKL